MEPVPGWARALSVVAAVVTLLVLTPIVAAGVLSLASVSARTGRTTAFPVGSAPRVRIDAQFSDVVVEADQDGRIEVSDQRGASSVTRAAAAVALGQSTVQTSQQGDLVVVSQSSALFQPPALNRSANITVRVPIHTDVDVSSVGSLQLRGLDSVVHIDSAAGEADLTDVTLRDTSALNVTVGQLVLRNVTVSGAVTVSKQLGDIQFDGDLAPGGSSLNIEAGTGGVTITLPHPTDARAAVVTQTGSLDADPIWHFTPEQATPPRRWTADLGPNPTGTVTVRTTVGEVEFDAR